MGEEEKLPAIASRIKQLFEAKGLNASSAAKELGYSVPSKLYSILSGTAAPGYATLTDMLDKWPDVSAEWLLMGRGEMLRGESGGAATPPTKAGAVERLPMVNSGQVVTITVDKEGDDNTELVPVSAQAGYTLHHNEAVFVKDLPRYRVPRFERGKFRAFEVAGDSMEPTLNHNDIVVCSFVDNWRLLIPDDIYVVVTDESVMLKRIRKRIDDLAGEVLLYSDNPHRRPYPVDSRDITQIWRVRGYISTYLPSAPDVTVERLWEVIEVLGFDKGEVRRHLDENATSHATL